MNSNKFDKFIGGIIQPDLSVTLENYNAWENGRKNQYVLAELCNTVKSFVLQKNDTPFLQLKDDEGNFIFNDRLFIQSETEKVKDFKTSLKMHQVDFISDGDDEYGAYYFVSYMTDIGPYTSIGRVLLKYKFSELNPFEIIALTSKPLKESARYLSENGEVFPDQKIRVDPLPLLHHYNETKKTWKIQSPFESFNTSLVFDLD